MIVAPASSGRRRDLLGDLEAVEVGHVGVEQHQQERAAVRRARRASASSAAGPLADRRRHHAPARQLRLQDPPVDGIVVDDQHRQLRQRSGSGPSPAASRPISKTR